MNTFNTQCVGVLGSEIIIASPRSRLTPREAIMFAAWLVVMVRTLDKNAPTLEQCIAAIEGE